MSLELLGHVDLPGNLKPGGFDHAAVHCASGRLYVAHTANDALDVIDCVHDRYLHSIPNLTGVAGALVSDEEHLVFTSIGEKTRWEYLRPAMRRAWQKLASVSAQMDLPMTRAKTFC